MRQIIIFTIFLLVISAVSAVECDNVLSTLPCHVTADLELVLGTYGVGDSEIRIYSDVVLNFNGSDFQGSPVVVGNNSVVKNGVFNGLGVGDIAPADFIAHNILIENILVDSREMGICFLNYVNVTVQTSQFLSSNPVNVCGDESQTHELLQIKESNITDTWAYNACEFYLTPDGREKDFDNDEIWDIGWNNVDDPEHLYPNAGTEDPYINTSIALANSSTDCNTDELSWVVEVINLADITDGTHDGYLCVNTTTNDIIKLQVVEWVEDDHIWGTYDTDGTLGDEQECVYETSDMAGFYSETDLVRLYNNTIKSTGNKKDIYLSDVASIGLDNYFENVRLLGAGSVHLYYGELVNTVVQHLDGGSDYSVLYLIDNDITSSDGAPTVNLVNTNVAVYLLLQDNRITVNGGDLVYLEDSTINNFFVTGNVVSMLAGSEKAINLVNTEVTTLTYQGNNITGDSGAEVGIWAQTGDTIYTVDFSGNRFDKMSDTFFYVSPIGQQGENVDIYDNYFSNVSYMPYMNRVDNVLMHNNEGKDILVQGLTALQGLSVDVRNNVVAGDSNTTRSLKGNGVVVTGIFTVVDSSHIDNNTLSGHLGLSLSSVDNTVVSNNTVYDFQLANKAAVNFPLYLTGVLVSGSVVDNEFIGEAVDAIDTFYTDNATAMIGTNVNTVFERNTFNTTNGGGFISYGRKRISDGLVLIPASNILMNENTIDVGVKVNAQNEQNNRFTGNYIKWMITNGTNDKAYNNQIGEGYAVGAVNPDYCNNTYSGYNNLECPQIYYLDCPAVIPNAGNYPETAKFNITFAVDAPRGPLTVAYSARLDEYMREGFCTKNDINASYAEITCEVDMNYWEPSDLYDASGNISDEVTRDETYFTTDKKSFAQTDVCEYYQLLAKLIQNPVLQFEIDPGESNVLAEVPMNVSNWGNVDILNALVIGFDLPGLTLPSSKLLATNFKINNVPSAVGAVALQNNVSKTVGLSLAAGENATAQMYLMVSMPVNQYPQNYRSNIPWILTLG